MRKLSPDTTTRSRSSRPRRTLLATLIGSALAVGSLAVAATPVSAADDWSRPVITLSDTGANASVPQVAVDPSGNAVAVWLRGGVVQAKRYTASTRTWGSVSTLSGASASDPQVAIAPNGDVIAVWQRANVIEFSRSVGLAGAFSAAALVSDPIVPGNPAAIPPTSDAGLSTTPRIAAATANNDFLVVWVRDALVQARRFSGSFGAIADVSTFGETGAAPQAAIDGTGRGQVIWRTLTGSAIDPLNPLTWKVQANRSGINNNTWGAPVNLPSGTTGDGFNAQIVVDGAGNAVALWNESIKVVRAARFNGTAWTALASPIADNQNNEAPQLAVDSNGAVIAIWEGSQGDHKVVKTARFTGASWSTPVVLSDPSIDAFGPRVIARASGFATAIWWQGTALGGSVQASTYLPDSNTWDPAVELAANVPFANDYDTDVAIDSVGKATAVWTATSGGNTVIQTSNSGNLAWSDQDLDLIRINVAYSDQVRAAGLGLAAATYSISAGALPTGITLNGTTGVVSGTATSFGDYSFTITATAGSQTLSKTFSGSIRSGFTTVTPARVFDTRGESSPVLRTVPVAQVGGGNILTVRMTGLGGNKVTPASGVGAVSLNVTVANPQGAGFLTVYPCGSIPGVSSVNFTANQVVANAVVAPLSTSGDLCFFSNVPTDVIVDINGWILNGAGFTAVTPGRIFDTRPGESPTAIVSVPKQQYGGSNILQVKVTNLAGFTPATGVGAVSLNVTVTNPSAGGFLTVYPCGGGVPGVSNVNFVANQTVPNAVITPVPADGLLCFFSNVPTHIIADINGWFATAGTGFNTVTPTRVFDTRPGESANAVRSVTKQKIGGTTELRVQMTGLPGGITPGTGVGAVSLNVTVTNPEAGGFVTVYPCGSRPFASNVNFTAGQTVANAVIAPLSATGELCFFSNVPTDIIADINGWFA